MESTPRQDFVTRSLLHHESQTYEIDLVHFRHDLKSDTHDTSGLIARGHAESGARKLTSSLWKVDPTRVQVSSQPAYFGRTTPGLLTICSAVAWPVASKVAKTTYHVLRPVSAVARLGREILVTFADGEHVRYDAASILDVCTTHTWNESFQTIRHLPRFTEWCRQNSIEPYTDHHPMADELMLGRYCKLHDLFGCWVCQAPVPPPPPLSVLELAESTSDN